MSHLVKIPSGVPGLDRVTLGGLPEGRTTLVTGKSGSAKSMLSLQLGANFARSGRKTLVLAVEEEPDDLRTSGDSLGFGVTDLAEQGLLTFADLRRPDGASLVVGGDFDVSPLLHRFESAAREGVKCVVLDSATALFTPRPSHDKLRALFFDIVRCLHHHGITAIITAEAPDDYGARTTLGVEDFVCDTVIILRNLIDDERRRRTLEVHKYRRSAHLKGEYPFTITDSGVVVFPFGQYVDEARSETSRFASGVPGLDEEIGGGWLRDSIMVLRGPAGSGKTTLAGMYARAGAARGERVAYYGFEETRPMLLRNFANMGLPIDEMVADERVLVQCRYPEATSPEDLLVELRRSVEEYQPSLIVLDSVSSIAHSTSQRGFRQFMVGFASLVREHNRSAVLTLTQGSSESHEGEAPFLSTIADTIVSLNYERRGKSLERTLCVTKMRGSSHSDDMFLLAFGQGGLTIAPMPDPPG